MELLEEAQVDFQKPVKLLLQLSCFLGDAGRGKAGAERYPSGGGERRRERRYR